MKKALVILPTFNEKENIKTLIPAIFEITKNETLKKWELHVLVIDDSSPDHTAEEVKKLIKKYPRLHLIIGKKQGLGKAYLHGFAWAEKNLQPYVVFEMDADWSHDPKTVPLFLKKIEEGADFVVGARYFIKGGSIPKTWALHRKILSFCANLIVRLGLMNLSVRDWTNGFRCIKFWFIKEIASEMNPFNGYVFQIALLDKASKRGLKISEIPCQFDDRKEGISKINTLQYIVNTLTYIFIYSSFIRFLIVGTSGFIVDIGVSILLVQIIKQNVYWSNIASMELAVLWNFILNNFWSFSHKKIVPSVSTYFKSFLLFNLTSFGSFAIQLGGIFILSSLFGKDNWVLWKISTIIFIVIPYSYFFYNKIIWKKRS